MAATTTRATAMTMATATMMTKATAMMTMGKGNNDDHKDDYDGKDDNSGGRGIPDRHIRSAKQDDNYGSSNIVLPCPGS